MSIVELQKKFIGKIISTNELITLKELLNWIYLDKNLTPVYLFSEQQSNKLEKKLENKFKMAIFILMTKFIFDGRRNTKDLN